MSLPSVHAEEKPYDYLIRGATVYDGKSHRPFQADVAISGEEITAVGQLEASDAKEIIDVDGLTLAPGFIDAHTHSDFSPFIYSATNKLFQGVTTEITGNCGMSAAPILGAHADQVRSVWAREGVDIPAQITWASFREYQNEGDAVPTMTNHAAIVGHGNIRSAVMGFANRKATAEEITQMKKILAAAMAEGAYGISFGLVYVPGVYADRQELIELCTEAARHGGLCSFHMRSEGAALAQSVRETIEIGEKSKARIQISHLKAAGKRNWEKIDKALRIIEEARARGVPIEADAYPYTASFAELGVLLPDDLYERPDRVAYFQEASHREELVKRLRRHYAERKMNWQAVMIATTPHKSFQAYEGKTLADIAKTEKKDPERVLVEFLAGTNFEISAFNFSQNEDVVAKILSRPYVSVGSDSIAEGTRRPHPRAYGTFPKVLGEFVRDKKVLRLGDAIVQMTSLPAEHFGLARRGRITSGYFADLVLFRAEEIRDLADFQSGNRLSQGVVWLFVNGKPVIRQGRFMETKNGRFLLRGE